MRGSRLDSRQEIGATLPLLKHQLSHALGHSMTSQAPAPTFSISELRYVFDGDNHDKRDAFRVLVNEELFTPRHNVSLEYERELALERLRRVSARRMISVFDFETNPLNIFAAHEIAGMIDSSFTTKMTVQYNLFAGTVLKLGSQRHRKYLQGVDNMSVIGCFALTELGYGNNAVEMETTATWDPTSKEFTINSPSVLSQKYWITNSAVHANHAVVFAQLYIDNKHEGIHAFLIRIREQDHSPSKGVVIHDMGKKQECNGVDNGKLSFDHVRCGREALLNRWSDVDDNGLFRSSIPNKRARFLKVADQLLSGRLCIASMILGATKTALGIALKFSATRLSVGEDGKSNAPILSYQLQQLSLIPLVSRTILLNFGLQYAKGRWARVSILPHSAKATKAQEREYEEIVRLCCAIKPLVTWNGERSASIARERCGGQGYLSVNRIQQVIGLSHAGISAEGDNAVLAQKVAKELLAAVDNGSYRLSTLEANSTRSWDFSGNPEDCLQLLQVREAECIRHLKTELTRLMGKDKKTLFDAWMHHLSDPIQHTATAFGEKFSAEEMWKVCQSSRGGVQEILVQLFHVATLNIITSNPYFLSTQLVTPVQHNACRATYERLVAKLAPQILYVVDAWGLPEQVVKETPAASFGNVRGWDGYNVGDNRGEVVSHRALAKL